MKYWYHQHYWIYSFSSNSSQFPSYKSIIYLNKKNKKKKKKKKRQLQLFKKNLKKKKDK